MTKSNAILSAQRLARKHRRDYYVVFEHEEGFQVANDDDLESYYLGATVHHHIDPDGTISD